MLQLQSRTIGILATLIMSTAIASGAEVLAAQYLAGDVDLSASVDAVDVQTVINAALGLPTSSDTNLDSSGETSAVDVQLVINAALGAPIDADGDSLADVAENGIGSNPAVADTDGDALGDGHEVRLGMNPTVYDAIEPLTLARKSEIFEYHLRQRSVLGGQVVAVRRAVPARPYVAYHLSDNAYMTGIYLGMLAMKNAVTGDPATRSQAGETIRALDLLCNVTGKKGLLARGAVRLDQPTVDTKEMHLSADGQYWWRGDVSSDQMDGVFYGFSLAYDLAANDEEKAIIARNARNLLDHLLENGLRIVDVDGEPTSWGHYEPEYVNNYEPMNALLFLQHVKVTAQVTGDPYYDQIYQEYAYNQNYANVALMARIMDDPVAGDVNHSDDVLLYLAFYPLLRLENDPVLRGKYLTSLARMWNGADGYPGVSPEANPLHTFNVHAYLNASGSDAAAIQTLQWFPLEMKWTPVRIEQYERELGFVNDPRVHSPEPLPGQPVPIDRRASAWSAWTQDPYVAGAKDPNSEKESNGHDYSAAYWLGRYHGYITEEM
ncbi:MAG: hypothetical protein HY706_20465 [Candidatus Hydrogenedentes bacterium]|nr:hypothetical protein [Candidatus Hydrogenedentota bacterium]